MSESPFSSLEECFRELLYSRGQGRCDHKLIDLVIITICAVAKKTGHCWPAMTGLLFYSIWLWA